MWAVGVSAVEIGVAKKSAWQSGMCFIQESGGRTNAAGELNRVFIQSSSTITVTKCSGADGRQLVS